MLAEVKTRLEAQVAALSDRVGLASDFAAALRSGRAPRGGVNVYVLPGTTLGVPAQVTGPGLFVQEVRRGVSVASILQSTDPRGLRALEEIDAFLASIQAALCGWAPGTETGVFELVSERQAPAQDGLFAYVTEFRIADQLRIST